MIGAPQTKGPAQLDRGYAQRNYLISPEPRACLTDVYVRGIPAPKGRKITGGTTMVRRGELTDRAWEQIEPLLPQEDAKKRGGRWRDHRTSVNGILWKLRTGSPWRDIPEKRYGPWQTCFDRFNRWRRDGTWDRLLTHAQTTSEGRWGCRVGGERRRHGNP